MSVSGMWFWFSYSAHMSLMFEAILQRDWVLALYAGIFAFVMAIYTDRELRRKRDQKEEEEGIE